MFVNPALYLVTSTASSGAPPPTSHNTHPWSKRQSKTLAPITTHSKSYYHNNGTGFYGTRRQHRQGTVSKNSCFAYSHFLALQLKGAPFVRFPSPIVNATTQRNLCIESRVSMTDCCNAPLQMAWVSNVVVFTHSLFHSFVFVFVSIGRACALVILCRCHCHCRSRQNDLRSKGNGQDFAIRFRTQPSSQCYQ